MLSVHGPQALNNTSVSRGSVISSDKQSVISSWHRHKEDLWHRESISVFIQRQGSTPNFQSSHFHQSSQERHGFRASVILTLFQGRVEERRKAISSSSTYHGPHAAMHTRVLFVFCCYGCRALSSERVRSQLHHAIVNDHDWLSPVHPGMSCINFDQCVSYIVLFFHRILFCISDLFLSHMNVCIHVAQVLCVSD